MYQTIAVDLNGSAFETFWAGTGFLLTEAIFMTPLGRLSDTIGRVPVLNISTLLFLMGTIICSVSNSFTILVFGRAVQGAGGGGVVVSLEIVVTDLVPLSARGNYLSIISALWLLGDVVGPILGGLLASRVSWVSSQVDVIQQSLIDILLAVDILDQYPNCCYWPCHN